MLAYRIALGLQHPNPEAVHYNLACALARLGRTNEAWTELERAVHLGYAALDKLTTDEDLQSLRVRPDWNERYAALQPNVVRLVGEFRVYEERDRVERYALCPSGGVALDAQASVDESCCAGVKYGQLIEHDGQYSVRWYAMCGKSGEGAKQSTATWPYVPCQPYERCSAATTCRQLAKSAAVATTLFNRADLPRVTQPAFDDSNDPGDVAFVPSPAPDACAEVDRMASKYDSRRPATR